MAAAPASAAAALTLLTTIPGYVNAIGFDLGQLVGATNDANCLLISKDNHGAPPVAVFVSASTSSASAGVLTIARNLRKIGITVLRYVISTTDLQAMVGSGTSAPFTSFAITPTDSEWLDTIKAMLVADTVG